MKAWGCPCWKPIHTSKNQYGGSYVYLFSSLLDIIIFRNQSIFERPENPQSRTHSAYTTHFMPCMIRSGMVRKVNVAAHITQTRVWIPFLSSLGLPSFPPPPQLFSSLPFTPSRLGNQVYYSPPHTHIHTHTNTSLHPPSYPNFGLGSSLAPKFVTVIQVCWPAGRHWRWQTVPKL